MFRGLLFYKAKGMSNDTSTLFLCLELKTLNEQLLEPALNLTVHCCGLEFRVLNGYDQKSFDEERGLNCVVQELQGEGLFEWVHGDDVAKTVFRMRNGHVEVYGYAFWVNQCTSGFHGVNEPGGVRVAREDDRGVTKGREDICEVFQQRGSRAERKLSRCGRNQMGNESILALPEGVDDFVVYYDARSKDLEACFEKGRRLTNRWLSMKKDIASCGSKYLAYSKVEVEYQGSSGLLLQPELPE
ncbi:hypothetical protein Tco_1069224 [Tanacetum coccineum]|uniref:Uncharacterized protein n=1 Tax=Tanacetum coccineum TaxID=301880 RepID=A0ABQ5HJS8_9ASTR